MTANAVTSLSLEPPLMIVCFAHTARTLAAVQHSGRFGVHFLSHDQEDVAARFASKMPEAARSSRASTGPSATACRRWAAAWRAWRARCGSCCRAATT